MLKTLSEENQVFAQKYLHPLPFGSPAKAIACFCHVTSEQSGDWLIVL